MGTAWDRSKFGQSRMSRHKNKQIPPSLLFSANGQISHCGHCILTAGNGAVSIYPTVFFIWPLQFFKGCGVGGWWQSQPHREICIRTIANFSQKEQRRNRWKVSICSWVGCPVWSKHRFTLIFHISCPFCFIFHQFIFAIDSNEKIWQLNCGEV